MKTRHQIVAYLGLLGMATLIAILLSIRDKLIAIGPWVLDVLLAVIGLIILYLLHKLYTKFRSNHIAMLAKQEELEGQRQTRRIENERWDVERAALLLNQQHQAGRIYPDPHGFMPTLVNVTEAGYQYVQLPHPAHQGRIAGQSQQQSIPEHAASLGLPTSIRYEQIANQIPAGHTLLGVSAQGVETKEFAALKTMLISGGSDSGKSNTLAIKIDEAMRLGRNTGLIVIDWHAYKPDSLTNKIKSYAHRFLMPVVTEEEETVPVLKHFLEHYKGRREAMKQAAEQGREMQFDDILLVCDEVPEMLDSGIPDLKETLNQVAKICGRSARGFGLFGWFVCQNMIGAASIRNYAHTIIAHKAVMLNEQKMVANGHMEIIQDMDTWPKGRVVVYGQSFIGTQVLQMPMFTPPVVEAGRGSGAVYVDDLDEMEPLQPFPNSANLLFQTQQRKSQSNQSETAQEKGGNETGQENRLDAFTLKNFLTDARKRRAEGTPLNTILKEYGLPSGGRTHQEVKELLDAMDIEAASE